MSTLLELYGATQHTDLVRWICNEYGIGTGQGLIPSPGLSTGSRTASQNRHRLRRAQIAVRVRLYHDEAKTDFETLIRQIFEDTDVQDQRCRLIDVASEMNVSRRIVDELASLYDKPALRRLASRDTEFHAEEQRLHLHEIMQQLQRMLELCNEALVWQYIGIDGQTRLRIVTPDVFDVISDPRDPTEMAGVLIDVSPNSMLPNRNVLPQYEVWDDTYRYLINANGDLVNERGELVSTPIEHGQKNAAGVGRIPGVLLHLEQPKDRALDARRGSDIKSAHLATGLLLVMAMRLAKSQGERQPVLKGNLATVAKKQRMDGETPLALPPEVEASMLDSKTDPDHYVTMIKVVLTGVAVTYGMSYEQLTYSETSTGPGVVYELRREKLKELRGERRRRAVINEHEVVELMGFDPTGMKVDHTEQALPQDPAEEIKLLDAKMHDGLDSPVAYLMRKDPDLSRGDALAKLKQNIDDWALVIAAARALNIPGAGGVANPGQNPQVNGANNGASNPASGATTQYPATGQATAAQAGAAA
jgi:hypothetical protein